MGLSVSDMAKIRLPHHTWAGKRLLTVNAVPLTIVATAQINMATIKYPLVALTVDNTSAGWLTEAQVGRMFMVGTAPGLHDVTVGVIRKATTATTLYISPLYAGEPGWATDIQQALADDYYVSIVKFRPPWGLGSIIRKSIFYKFWDTVYTDQGKKPFSLVNMGDHQQADVDPATGLARFTVPIDPYYWANQAYSAHSWGLDGQTEISSSASQLVVDCAPGCHEITYQLTNTQGKVTTAYRYLFANDDTIFPAFNDTHDVTVECQGNRQGCSFTVTIQDPLDTDEIFPGQLWLMTLDPRWGNQATGVYYGPNDLSDPDAVCTHFVGYVTETGLRMARGARETTLTLESPVRIAQDVPVEKQIIIEKTTPGNWAEVSKTLSNPVGMFYYLSTFHAPYLVNGHDFQFDAFLLTLRRKSQNLDSDVTLGGQLAQLMAFLDGEGNIGSDTSGTTWMLRNPVYLASATRYALATRYAWITDDLDGELERPLRFRPQVGKTYAGAFAYNGASESLAWRSLAPGYVRSQAGGETTMDDTTVTAAGGQDRVNEIAGFHHARQNLKSGPFEFAVNGLIDVADPARLDEWHTFTVPATYDPLGDGWTSARFLPLTVTRRWSGPGGRRCEIRVEADPESFGYPGIALPINPGGGAIWVTSPAPAYFGPYQDKIPDLGLSIAAMVAWNTAYRAGYSYNWGSPHTGYAYLAGVDDPGEVVDATLNPNSGFFSDPANPLELVLLTYDLDTDTLAVYSVADLLNDPLSRTLVTSFSGVKGSGSFPYTAQVRIDENTADFWVVGWKNRDGTYVQRSTDGGANWSGGAVGYVAEPDDDHVTDPLGLDVKGGHTVVVARDGTQDVGGNYIYFVYHAATTGGAFAKVSNPTDYTVAPSSLALTSTSNCIVPLFKRAAPAPANPLDVVDFDGGYDGTVDITGPTSGGSSGAGTSAAYPAQNSMAYGSRNKGFGTDVYVNVTVDLDAFYTFHQVSFWTAFLAGWTLINRSSRITVGVLDAEQQVIKQYDLPIDGAFPTNEGTYTVTAEDLGLDGTEQTWYVRVSILLNWTDDAGSGTTYVFVDDIDIDADLIAFDTDRALHTLALGTGTYTQRQSYQRLPFHQYGIAASGNSVTCIACDENGNQPALLLSTNGGTSWTKARSLPGFVGAKRSLFAAVLFGYNRLAFSPDGGITLYSMVGDWAARVGPMARFDGVAGVLGII